MFLHKETVNSSYYMKTLSQQMMNS